MVSILCVKDIGDIGELEVMNFMSVFKRIVIHIIIQLPYRILKFFHKIFYLNLTPEGHRSRGERWVTGSWKELLDIGELAHISRAHRYYWIASSLKGRKVLDVGCGSGYGSYYLSLFADSVVGIDNDMRVIEWAKQHFKRPNLSFEVGDALNMRFTPNTFDVVVCVEVIEHLCLRDQEKLLKQIKSVCSNKLYITTPNADPLCFRVMALESAKSYGLCKFHIRELCPDDFKKLLQKYFSHCTLFGQHINGVKTLEGWLKSRKRLFMLSDLEMIQTNFKMCPNIVAVCE